MTTGETIWHKKKTHTNLFNKTKFTSYFVPPAHAPGSVYCCWCLGWNVRMESQLFSCPSTLTVSCLNDTILPNITSIAKGGHLKPLEYIHVFALFLIFCHLSTHPKTHTQTWPIATITLLSPDGSSEGSSTATAATKTTRGRRWPHGGGSATAEQWWRGCWGLYGYGMSGGQTIS